MNIEDTKDRISGAGVMTPPPVKEATEEKKASADEKEGSQK
jgi:hypothetical protein